MPLAAIISPNPSNRAGGVERVCTLLADTLQAQGWQTCIVGPQRAVAQWEFRLGLGFGAQSRAAGRRARALRPDLVVSNGYLGGGGGGSTPRLHVYHGTMVGCARALSGQLPARELTRRALGGGLAEALCSRGARRVVCVSDAVAEEVRRWYRVSETRVIPNGVDTDTFAPRDRRKARERFGLQQMGRYAVFVGRFEAGKGADIALQGAQRAGFELLVAGPNGPAQARCLGVLDPEMLAEAYAAADCVVLPSHYEACSLVVLEALACGRPLLTTRVGWMKTLLREVPAYDRLCVKTSVGEVQERLQTLDRLPTSALSEAARAYVIEQCSLRRWSQRWLELVAETLPRVKTEQLPAQTGAS